MRSRFFWFGLAGLLLGAAALYGFFFTPFLQIKRIEITGNENIATEKIERIAREHLSQKVLFFKMNHLFLADARGAAQKIQAAFPEVESVVARKRFPDSVRLVVQERKAVAAWCQGGLALSEGCFALDRHGVVFEEKEPEREVILSAEGSKAVLRNRVVKPALLENILRFRQALDASALFQQVGLRVSSLHIVSSERVNGSISEGWKVYFNPAESIDWQTTKLKLVLEQEIPFQKRPFLEYIDLRFGDQAYIKYK